MNKKYIVTYRIKSLPETSPFKEQKVETKEIALSNERLLILDEELNDWTFIMFKDIEWLKIETIL